MKIGISPAVLPRYCRLSTGSVAIARRNAAAVVRAAGDSVDQIRSDQIRADQIRSADVNRGPYAVAVLALAVLVFFVAAALVAFAAFSAVFRCSDVCTPNFLLNRSTRPSVSISFCRPVKNGWQAAQISRCRSGLVERVLNVLPHAQRTSTASYLG